MELRCKVCRAVQPVTCADEADEDLRTQGIRRAFRVEHVATCGNGSVSLQLGDPDLDPIDATAWQAYLEDRKPPLGVVAQADGSFTRTITRDGQVLDVRACEDCWQTIPRYMDFSWGLTSPESDGSGEAVPKLRPTTVDTSNVNRGQALESLRRVVCLPCYLAAFARVYPGHPLPVMSDEVVGDGAPTPPPAPAPYIFIEDGKSVAGERAPLQDLMPPPDDPRWREAEAAMQG